MSGPATHMTMSVFNKNHRFIARVLCGGFMFSVKCVCTVRVFLLHLDYHLGPVCVFGGVRILHTYFPWYVQFACGFGLSGNGKPYGSEQPSPITVQWKILNPQHFESDRTSRQKQMKLFYQNHKCVESDKIHNNDMYLCSLVCCKKIIVQNLSTSFTTQHTHTRAD